MEIAFEYGIMLRKKLILSCYHEQTALMLRDVVKSIMVFVSWIKKLGKTVVTFVIRQSRLLSALLILLH
jgi:hypothetical protein